MRISDGPFLSSAAMHGMASRQCATSYLRNSPSHGGDRNPKPRQVKAVHRYKNGFGNGRQVLSDMAMK